MRLFVAAYPPSPAVSDLANFVASLRVGRAAAAGVNTRLARPETYHLTLAFLGEVPDERLPDVETAIGSAVEPRTLAPPRRRRATGPTRLAERADGPRKHEAQSDRPTFPAAVVSHPGDAVTGPRQQTGSGIGRVRESETPSARHDPAQRSASPGEFPQAGHVGGVDGPAELALAGGGRFGRGAFTLMWVGVTGDLDPMRALHRALRRELKRARLPYDDRPWKPHLTIARPGDRIPRADVEADKADLNAYEGPRWPVRELLLMRSNPGPQPTYERLTNWLL